MSLALPRSLSLGAAPSGEELGEIAPAHPHSSGAPQPGKRDLERERDLERDLERAPRFFFRVISSFVSCMPWRAPAVPTTLGCVGGMHDTNDEITLPFQKLDICAAAKELAVRVHAARISDSELRDQARRASKSCFLNLSEGLPSDSAPMRRRYFASAGCSAAETAAAVDLAAAIGVLDPTVAATIQRLAVRIKKMLRALR